MVRFPSDEWIKTFKEGLNKSKSYEEVAKTWEGDFLFVITPDEELKKEVVFYVDLWHGKCRESAVLPNRHSKKVPYIYEGPYKSWRRILSGELDPIKALLTRKMSLTGDMAMVMRATRAAKELVRTVQMIDTEYL